MHLKKKQKLAKREKKDKKRQKICKKKTEIGFFFKIKRQKLPKKKKRKNGQINQMAIIKKSDPSSKTQKEKARKLPK